VTEETRPRLYYSIREVSEMLDVKAHVLRYWESQFPTLRPKKSRGGARMYRDSDLDTLRSIRELLYERRYTIAGARRRLSAPADVASAPGDDDEEPTEETEAAAKEATRDTPKDAATGELEFLHPSHRRALREIRRELLSLRAWLQDPNGAGPRRTRRTVILDPLVAPPEQGEISIDALPPAP